MQKQLQPLAALTHPAWLVALAVLVFNDHFLKASALMPSVSGKLSDFAGLLVAPVLLAAVLRVRTKTGLALSALATGLVFAAINLSASTAAMWDAAISRFMPFRTTVDPTDLVALTMLPLGFLLFAPVMSAGVNRSRSRRAAQFALAGFGILMCTATSEDESCTTNADCRQGDVCVNEWCETPPEPCNTDADCGAAHMECAAGFCSYRPTCQQPSDCPSGVCEPDGRCDLAGVPIGGSNMSMSMMGTHEAESLDETTLRELEHTPLRSLDPVVLDYLHDAALPQR